MTESFCIYPWVNLHTNTDGRCKLCCHIYEEEYISNSSKKSLVLGFDDTEEVWNGQYMQDVRSKMLAGEKVEACMRCYEHEELGLESSRQWANKTYFKNQEVSDVIVKSMPTHLELRLGNVCNLKCNSCWSVSSNAIYKERKKALGNESLPQWLRDQWSHEVKAVEDFDWDWYKTDKFRKFIADCAPNLERLYLTGGEPLLIPENTDILRQMSAAGNKRCHVAFTTNLTKWSDNFYDLLNEFNTSEVQMSIDGIEGSASYIRHPSKWNQLNDNFVKCLSLPKKIELKIYCVIQAWNILNITDILDWLIARPSKRRVDFVPLFLEHPDQIHCCVWPDKYLQKVIASLKNYLNTEYKDSVNSIISYLKGNMNKYGDSEIHKMHQFIKVNDPLRKTNFSKSFPHLNQIINEAINERV